MPFVLPFISGRLHFFVFLRVSISFRHEQKRSNKKANVSSCYNDVGDQHFNYFLRGQIMKKHDCRCLGLKRQSNLSLPRLLSKE